jgi:hypothetical protein
MSIVVRKVVSHREVTTREYGQEIAEHVVAWVACVIENPYPAGYVADVVTLADEIAAEIGELIGPACVELLGVEVEAFGKAAIVGVDGELEHGSALIHNLRFGNKFRDAAGGTELLPAVEKVGLMGATADVPLKHKLDSKTRSHHQTVTISIPGAPLPREIVIACVASSAGRPNQRLAAFASEVK